MYNALKQHEILLYNNKQIERKDFNRQNEKYKQIEMKIINRQNEN